MKAFKFPIIRKVFPKLMTSDLIAIQPMTAPSSSLFFGSYKFIDVIAGVTYFAKGVDGPGNIKIWKLCTMKDIYQPDYIPCFAITTLHSYAIYNEDGKPIVCTDREIFKNYTLDIECPQVAKEEYTLVHFDVNKLPTNENF